MAVTERETTTAAFVTQLQCAYDVELQLVNALPRIAVAASADELRSTLDVHLEETRGHVARLEATFRLVGVSPSATPRAALAGVLAQCPAVFEHGDPGTAANDAALIDICRRIARIEIETYEALVASATTLAMDDAATMLQETLDEERYADSALLALTVADVDDLDHIGAGDGRQGSRTLVPRTE